MGGGARGVPSGGGEGGVGGGSGVLTPREEGEHPPCFGHREYRWMRGRPLRGRARSGEAASTWVPPGLGGRSGGRWCRGEGGGQRSVGGLFFGGRGSNPQRMCPPCTAAAAPTGRHRHLSPPPPTGATRVAGATGEAPSFLTHSCPSLQLPPTHTSRTAVPAVDTPAPPLAPRIPRSSRRYYHGSGVPSPQCVPRAQGAGR